MSLKERYTTGKREREARAELNQRILDRTRKVLEQSNKHVGQDFVADLEIMEIIRQQEIRLSEIMVVSPAQLYTRSIGIDVSRWNQEMFGSWDMATGSDRTVVQLAHKVAAMCHPSRNGITGLGGDVGVFRDGDMPERWEFPAGAPDREEAIPAPDWPVRIPVEVER